MKLSGQILTHQSDGECLTKDFFVGNSVLGRRKRVNQIDRHVSTIYSIKHIVQSIMHSWLKTKKISYNSGGAYESF